MQVRPLSLIETDYVEKLFSVVNMAEKYASRYGTNHRSEWTIKRLTITGANPAGLTGMAENVNVIDASQVDLAKLAKFDRTVCKESDRQQWLAAWINHPAGWSRVRNSFFTNN